MVTVLWFIIFWGCFVLVVCLTKQDIECDPPINPLYGNYKTKRKNYVPDDTIEYMCNDGTYLYGSKTRRCLSNGTWNEKTPYCVKSILKRITFDKDALKHLTDGNYSTCVIYKSTKYLKFNYKGDDTREAVLRLVWKALTQNREEKDKHINSQRMACKKLNKSTNDSLAFNEYMCSLTRDQNYTFNVPAVGTERWLCEVEMFMKRDDICPKLSIKNGSVHYDLSSNALTYGSTASIKCSEGYKTLNMGINYCSEDGKWHSNSSCEKAQCEPLGKIKNGSIVYNGFTYLEIARLFCNEGYMPTANTEVSCQLDGKWAVHDFNCTLIDCRNRDNVKNGLISYVNTTLHGIAFLKCDNGYRIMHESNSTCLKNGSWSYSNFECKEIRCYKPPVPNNGGIWLQSKESLGNATVGTKARLQCKPNFTKTRGPLYVECLSSGNWSTTNVTCKSVTGSSKRVVIIAAVVGAVSSAAMLICIFVCLVLLRRWKRRQQPPDACIPLKESVERKPSTEKHEYSVVIYEEIRDIQKKKPTSPLPKIPSTESEFNYSFPIDQKKYPDDCSGSNYNYMEPEDAYKTEGSPVKMRINIKRRNSSADSTYWRYNDDMSRYLGASNTPKLRRLGSNTSLPDFPANKFSVFENDLYSSD